MNALMALKIVLPVRIFSQDEAVSRIVVETPGGSMGLLPHRQDCITAIAQGILVYQSESRGEVFAAVDEGILVKAGPMVLVSVRGAIAGPDLGHLRDRVEEEFMELDERERIERTATARLEAAFLHRFAGMRNG